MDCPARHAGNDRGFALRDVCLAEGSVGAALGEPEPRRVAVFSLPPSK